MVASKEITKLENSNVKLTVSIKQADVAASYKDVLKNYIKSAQIPGFRKGKVPASVLETKYGDAIKADALSTIIETALGEVFDTIEEKPLPYAQPSLEKFPELDVTKDLEFAVTYDIFPQAEVKTLDGITIEVPQVSIADKDLQQELEEIQERNSIVTEKNDDEKAVKDDILTVSYSELDDTNEVISGTERQDYVFAVGSGHNIYKFDDDVIGMKKGETKDITKTYPADFEDKDLAGKTKKVRITVTAIKVKNVPALDDDLAQDVNEKFKTLDDLKTDVKKNMQTALDARLMEIKTNALLEQLVEKNPITLPASMVAAELDSRWRSTAQRFQASEDQLLKILTASGQTKESMLESWKPDTEKALKSRIIVEQLIKDRKIEVTPEDIEKEYASIAEKSGSSLEEIKKHYADPRMKEYLIDDTKLQRLYDQLLETAKITKGKKVDFSELFAQQN